MAAHRTGAALLGAVPVKCRMTKANPQRIESDSNKTATSLPLLANGAAAIVVMFITSLMMPRSWLQLTAELLLCTAHLVPAPLLQLLAVSLPAVAIGVHT